MDTFFNLRAQCQPASLLPLLGRVHCQQPMVMGLRATGPSACFQGLRSAIYVLHVDLLTSTVNAVCFPMCRPCTGGAACTGGHSLPQSTNTFLRFAFFFFFFLTNTNVELIGRDSIGPCRCRRQGVYGWLSWSQFCQL